METTRNLTDTERLEILKEEYAKALANIPPRSDKLRSYQINAAKGIATKRALKRISDITGEGWV